MSEQNNNPLLERLNKLPGITVRMPSKGLFYKNNELDDSVHDGEVVVHPMTLTDELVMKSPDMLFQGTAIDSVFKRCIPQIKKPLELLMGDIDYLLTQLRRVSYGATIPFVYECDCMKKEEHVKKAEKLKLAGELEYQIPISDLIATTKELTPSDFHQYKVSLDNGQTITLRPLRFCDFLKMQQINDNDEALDRNKLEEMVVDNLTSITISVDEISDPEQIREWYKVLPRLYTEKITNKLKELSTWGIDFKYSIVCKVCKEKKDITTQLNPVYFFTLPSSPEMKN